MKPLPHNRTYIGLKIRDFYYYVFYLLAFILFTANVYSQYISKNNFEGFWLSDDTWQNTVNPGTIIDGTNIVINGLVKAHNCIELNNGTLFINDTIIVYGNLNLANNARLEVSQGGVLLIYGNYTSNNKVEVLNEGLMVITGEFEMLGSDNQGYFYNSRGRLFIYDSLPELKTGPNYSDLYCLSNTESNCGYGNQKDIIAIPEWEYISKLIYNELILTNKSGSCELVDFIANITTTCINTKIEFTDYSIGFDEKATLTWTFGEGANPDEITGRGPYEVYYSTAGEKTVKLTITTPDQNNYVIEKTVSIYELPVIKIDNTERCGPGEVFFIINNPENYNIDFSFDEGQNILSPNSYEGDSIAVFLSNVDSIQLWVNVTDDSNNCQSGWYKVASAYMYPIVAENINIDDVSRCGEGEAIFNIGKFDKVLFSFSTDQGDNILTNTVNDDGRLEIELAENDNLDLWIQSTDTITGCKSEWIYIASAVSLPVPVVKIEGPETVCEDEISVYIVTEEFETYLWQDGSSTREFQTSEPTTLIVTVTNEFGCSASDVFKIHECKKNNVLNTHKYAFTPNYDGINDKWVIDGIEYFPNAKIRVFDRTGKLVYQSDGFYNNDWNGSYQGEILPLDSYYFIIDLGVYNLGIVKGIITILSYR